MTTQCNVIKELASTQKTVHIKPLPITYIRLPTTPATHTTPRIPQPLPNLPLTTTSSIPDLLRPQPLMQRLVLPMHLFNEIPQPMREYDLSNYSNCGTNPGSFGVLFLKHFSRYYLHQIRIVFITLTGAVVSSANMQQKECYKGVCHCTLPISVHRVSLPCFGC
ncbi:unnamed protein product [Mytilus edulis]|uniref:Uncharacterized protein n=1 Tax=Mytilus edulis TaxID=6550 RepID=A0A8S3QQE2_MYTED|nr:unnamed protein product [Mytilus edulis]